MSHLSIAVYPCECGHVPHVEPCTRKLDDLLDGDSAWTLVNVHGAEPTEPCVCPAYREDTANGLIVTEDTEDRWTVEAMTARAKAEIIADAQNPSATRHGALPFDVPTFSALHDYVDANEYGGICDPGSPSASWEPTSDPAVVQMVAEQHSDRVNAMQDEVDRWLKDGGLLDALGVVTVYVRLDFLPDEVVTHPTREAVIGGLEARFDEVYVGYTADSGEEWSWPLTPKVTFIDGPA